MPDPTTAFHVTVHGIIVQEDKILLGQRYNTGYGDGFYAFPSGHIEPFETATSALCREMLEELDVCPVFNASAARPAPELPVLTVEHLCDMGRLSAPATRFRPYHHLFFWLPDGYDGDLRNNEPEKCADLRFFPRKQLPANFLPLSRHALSEIEQGHSFSRFGWDNPDYKLWKRLYAPG